MADIELVIDIPEDVYTRLFDSGIQDNEIAVDDVCEMARALRIGTPFNSVIEDIKAEIKNLTYYWCEVNPKTVIDDVLEIIDKHISGKEKTNGSNNRNSSKE